MYATYMTFTYSWSKEYIGNGTVSFHNFKSRNFKLSFSNPESKYVAYLPVLSRT